MLHLTNYLAPSPSPMLYPRSALTHYPATFASTGWSPAVSAAPDILSSTAATETVHLPHRPLRRRGRASFSRAVLLPVLINPTKRRTHRMTPSLYQVSANACFTVTCHQGYVGDSIEVSEWESGKPLDSILEDQGIRIRRRPPSGLPVHMVGSFEFHLEKEGNTPRNILEQIIWDKDVEITQLKGTKPLSRLTKDLENAPPVRDFLGALKASYQRTGLPALIAEVKKASPSRGVLREGFDPLEIAYAYEKSGAACLSILTDEKYFQGSFENLEAVRRAGVKCPLLCKEFVIDAWQIYYARSKGADAILLIAAVLSDAEIKYMIKICHKLGIAALVEVHNEREIDRVLGIDGIQLIGINNRNLETFEVDISNTRRLLEGERGQTIRNKGITVVGESGLFTPEDISFVQDAGVTVVLVGESLIKQDDPGKGISQLFGKDISI